MTDIAGLLGATLEVTGTRMSDHAVQMMVRRLSSESPAAVRAALGRCADECRGRLTLADILARLPREPNHVPANPDEAWTMAVALVGNAGETSTIIAPEAILAAFPHSLWNQGDEVAARMAFKAAYPAAVAKHGSRWEISDGYDSRGREVAILSAMRAGQLEPWRCRALLPHLPDETFAGASPAALPGPTT